MTIKKAQYVYGFALFEQYKPMQFPEIALAGRSNVGKSSLINMLTNNSKLARVASTPGKTSMINVFLINDALTLMDLPGYGFAKVSNAEKERWSNLIESYLHKSQNLAHVFLLLDIRHKPTSDDLTMIKWLNYYQKPFSIIATKADKLSKSQLSKQLLELSRETGMIVNDIYPVSSISGQGKDKILLKIGEILQNYSLKQQD